MSVKFFGDFLLGEGQVERHQLRQALEHMSWLNRRIGELAVKRNLMSPDDVDRVLEAQMGSDVLFGELAVQLGLLDARQLEELLEDQHGRRVRPTTPLGHAPVLKKAPGSAVA